MGNITRTQHENASGTATYFEDSLYDELGRLRGIVGAHAQDPTFAYDVEDNLIKANDAIGKTREYGFDALNRLVSEYDGVNNALTSMTHNDADQVTQYTDPRNVATSFSYNGFGEVIQETSADRGTMNYTYGARGLVTSMTDGRGVVSNYTYDNGGRITSRTFPSSPAHDQLFTYDGTANGSQGQGNIHTISDEAGVITREYGDGGKLKLDRRQIGAATYDTKYFYNGKGLLSRIKTSSELSIKFSYTGQQQIKSVKIQRNVVDPATGQLPPEKVVVDDGNYRPFGPLFQFNYGDGGEHTKDHDQSYRATRVRDTMGGVAFRDVSYGWSVRDDLRTVTDNLNSLNSEDFKYSAQQRLRFATGPYGEIEFTYNKVGDRASRKLDDFGTVTTEDYTYPEDSNRLASISTGVSSRTFSHDMAGNVTYDNRSGGGYGYGYNAAGRMSEFSINGVLQAEYVYNALGQQVVQRLVQDGKTLHVIHDADGNRLVEYEYDPVAGTSTLLREYIWMDGEAVGVVENDQLFFIRTDHIGRPVFATDELGGKIWEVSYLPFGRIDTFWQITPLTIGFNFPGQWYQTGSGLHQNWMRDYDPTTGRYLQADPLGLVDGPSVYGYALQNPGRYTDPRGERGVPSGSLAGTFGMIPPPVGFSVNPHNMEMSTWPQFKPRDVPDPSNINDGPQCSRNSCMLRTEVSSEQLKAAGLHPGGSGPGGTKGCLYRCPGGKMKLELFSKNFQCPPTISDFPGQTYNDLSSFELLNLRGVGVRY